MLKTGAKGRNRLILISIVGAFAVAGGLGVIFFQEEMVGLLEIVKEWLEAGLAFVEEEKPHPFIYFTVAGLLTAFGCPISPLYFAGAAIYGKTDSLIYAPWCASLTIAVGYWANLTIARPVVKWLLARAGYTIPTISPDNYLRFTILCRITPGMPATIQNTILALGGVPFGKYFIGSFPIMMAWVIAFILLGESMMEGNAGLAITAVLLIVFLALALRILRSRLDKPSSNAPEQPENPLADETQPDA